MTSGARRVSDVSKLFPQASVYTGEQQDTNAAQFIVQLLFGSYASVQVNSRKYAQHGITLQLYIKVTIVLVKWHFKLKIFLNKFKADFSTK